jgi:hypothetical protein
MGVEFNRSLLETRMTRKEFLQFLGGSVAILLGLSNFVQLLQKTKADTQQTSKASHGFGSRKFGA